jgi:dihydrofolate synthase/folylpolyglutamate synthase
LQADLFLLGRFQATNAGLALTLAAQALAAHGRSLQPGPSVRGLARARWPGRMEALRLSPPWVYDGAHTAESAEVLAAALRQHFPGLRWRFCIGLTGRREPARVVAPLAPLAKEIVAVPVPSAQAVDPCRVLEAAQSLGLSARLAPSLADALDEVPVCVTGSLYLYGALPESVRPRRVRFVG